METSHIQVGTAELLNVRSLTLLIHGVGDASSESLLGNAARGYASSGLGESAGRGVLKDCPSLAKVGDGCECLLLGPDDARHIVIALPWAERRLRLATIALVSMFVLLGLTAAALVSFAFRSQLEAARLWLGSWQHFLIAYAALFVLGFLAYLINPDQKKFEPPSTGFLFLPLLLLFLLLFLHRATWFWIPAFALIGALWSMAVVALTRSLVVSKVFSWSVALACLGVVLTISSAGLMRLTWQFIGPAAMEARYQAADDELLSANLRAILGVSSLDAPGYPASDSITNEPMGDVPGDKSRPETVSVSKVGSPNRRHLERSTVLSPYNFPDQDESTRPRETSIVQLMSWSEFLRTLAVLGVLLGLCLLVRFWHWPLDLLLDVISYTGHHKHREALLNGTLRVVEWLRATAPEATLVVVSHSLGSVVATHSIFRLQPSESLKKRVVLITLGSPLNYLSRLAPNCVMSTQELAPAICSRVRWINAWRSSDPVGKSLAVGSSHVSQICVGPGGHSNYWADPKVWSVLAREVLASDSPSAETRVMVADGCMIERNLWALIAVAIATLSIAGIGSWLLTV
jgi:hypothetical protein